MYARAAIGRSSRTFSTLLEQDQPPRGPHDWASPDHWPLRSGSAPVFSQWPASRVDGGLFRGKQAMAEDGPWMRHGPRE